MDVADAGGQRAVGEAALLTAEQRAAIDLRAASVSLSAGAGCGKTFVLTRRFLSHLEPEPGEANSSPDTVAERVAERLSRLVAITFTERAAREMRDRIRSVCRQRLFERDPREAPHWLALLRALDSARISTIHAFCGSLLRTHAVEAGLDPHFVTLDESQAATLAGEIIDSVLRTRLAARDERAVDLVQRFGLEPLKNLVRELWSERTKIDWDAWRTKSVPEVLAAWQEFRLGPGGRAALARFANSHEAARLIKLLDEHQPNHPVMSARWQTLRETLPRLGEQEDLEIGLTLVRENAMVKGGGAAKAWESDDVYQVVKGALGKFRDAVDKVRERFAWNPDAARQAAEQGLRVLALASDVSQAYTQRKRELAALDFDDLILRARDLLAEPRHKELRRRLSERLDLLLVDEFQDTDMVQTDLVRLLCGEGLEQGKLFFVGDVKQSIYRFRGADPRVFVDLSASVPAAGRLPLSANFRSQPAILQFVNHLFCESLGRETEYQPLRAVRSQVTPEPAIELLWANADGSGPVSSQRAGAASGNLTSSWGNDLPQPTADDEDDDDEDINAQLQAAGREGAPGEPDDDEDESVAELRRREARWVARRLRQLFDAQTPIVHDAQAPGGARPARPGDTAILFKTLSDVQHYEAALRDEGIDYYLVGGHAFYAQQEIFDLANLLRSLARPADDVSLAGVLRSPFFSLADETLLWLVYQSESLSQAMLAEAIPVELDAEQAARVRFARQTLAELRALKDRLPLAELVERALAQTGYDAALVAEFMGARKLANLRKLVDLARSFDQSGIFTLDDFVGQLLDQVATLPKEAPAATEAENANVVRLMTIHQSKGLEFPLVVVPDINRQPRASTEVIAFDPELGPLLRPADEAQRRGAGPGLELYRLRAAEDDLAEQIRLFYVAVTRAADYLILSAGVNEVGAADSPWTKLLAERFDLLTGAGIGGQGSGTGAPQVRVTLREPQTAASERKTTRHNLTEIVTRARTAAGSVPRLAAAAPVDLQARRQFSISRLRGTIEAVRTVQQGGPVVDDADATPLVAEQAAALGTLVHAALELIDFQQPGDLAAILERQAIEFSQSKQGAMPTEADLADARRLVERFLKSPRAAALASAQRLLREVEFVLAWPPGRRVLPTSVTLRGFLDCLYQDDAGWHLLDYKTNHLSVAQVAEVAKEYELQMLLYGLVVHEVTGQPPTSLTLCFLRPGAEHTIRWDDAARQRAISLVDVALAKARGGEGPRRHAGRPTARPNVTASMLDALERPG